MRTNDSLRLVGWICAGLLGAAVVAACSSKTEAGPRKSRKGEVCQTTQDCDGSLSCVPKGGTSGLGICVQGEFKVAKTAKECVVIQCTKAKDCCPTLPSSCTQLDADCKQGITSACTQYDRLCVCDEDKFRCEKNKCTSVCSDDADCGGVSKCVDGECVQCEADDDCDRVNPGAICSSGACVQPCKADTECALFSRCSKGRCVEGGCETNRECVAATDNVEALCQNKKCVVPCQTDLECGNPTDYKFFSCIDKQCVYVGCESDKECQFYVGNSGTPIPGSKPPQIACKDKAN